jgi:hypothetical protein
VAGPLDGVRTNRLDNIKIILRRGFDVPLQIVDGKTGEPVAGAKVATMFSIRNSGFQTYFWESRKDGIVSLTHCADLPLNVEVNASGYEIARQDFEHLRAGEPLRLVLRRGAAVSGIVLDKRTGQPISGAEIHMLYQSSAGVPLQFRWEDPFGVLGETDAQGKFTTSKVPRGAGAYLGVSAPGRGSVMLDHIFAGTSNLVARLGPELVVRGRVMGDIQSTEPVLSHLIEEKYENNTWSDSDRVALRVESGVARFEFTNRLAGVVRLSVAGQTFERNVDGPVDNWAIDLKGKKTRAKTNGSARLPKREVIFRFKSFSGVSPKGTVSVQIPDNLDVNHLTAHNAEMTISNSEVRAEIPIGGRTSIEPAHMVGYWFSRSARVDGGNLLSIEVTDGVGPLVINIPVLPAGAIFAKALNADGSPAGGLFFGLTELKRAPGQDDSNGPDSGSDGFSDTTPRTWVSGPLPLGGTYQVYAWRGNLFCDSKPVKLTEAAPDAEVQLQFLRGQSFDGLVLDPRGDPLNAAKIKPQFVLVNDHRFGLPPVFTDERGRFRLENTTPEEGDYLVEVEAPGMMAEPIKLHFGSQPQTIRLQQGRTLGGRVVQAGTGYAIPYAELRTQNFDSDHLPIVTTRTDADGYFQLTTLSDANYSLFCPDGQLSPSQKFHANGTTNIVLTAKLYPWSRVKPKAPQAD